MELTEFVDLKSKQYSILCSCDTIHRAKGVSLAADDELVHADYLHTLGKKTTKHCSLFCNTKFQTQTAHSGYRKNSPQRI